ncbi:sensor histidine kinase [Geopsychrobacter electrodiphilus]|uniref:sensor histidine kinase n=1 Tax=Geopsychrobacter electrodiphilus TaxID=225196 RepID=UPI00036B7DD6|nr:HAMP domain-containing sensor histidine kinase [Geopsychrobacter electrodiphilus]
MKFQTKLIILTLLANLLLAAGAWQLMIGVNAVQKQVQLFVPATGYLQGISGVHSALTRQARESLDYLISRNPADKKNFFTTGKALDKAFLLWRESAAQQLALKVEGEQEDLERAEATYLLYLGWQKEMREIFALTDQQKWVMALKKFQGAWETHLNNKLFPAINQALHDGMVEVEDTYHGLTLAVGIIPWDLTASSRQLDEIHNVMNILIDGNQVNASVNSQFSALIDYLLNNNADSLERYEHSKIISQEALADWLHVAEKAEPSDHQPSATGQQIAAIDRTFQRFAQQAESAIALKKAGLTTRALALIGGQDDSLIADFHNSTSITIRDGAKALVTRATASRTTGILFLFSIFGFISLFSLGIVREMFASLKTLSTGMDCIGAGDLSHRIVLKGDDVTGRLAQTFNTMMDSLCHSQRDLKKLTSELEQRVENRTLELEAVNRDLEAFNAMVSHDLRSPLAIISGYCELLLAKEMSQSDEAVEQIASAADNIAQIVSALENLTCASLRPLNDEKIDLSQMAAKVIAELQFNSPTSPLDIQIHPTPLAVGDPHLLEIMLTNLLGNALKYSAQTALPRIEFGAFSEQGQTVWFVRDNGAGFDHLKKDMLFKPFGRLHSSKEFPGTGIGLLTVQRIIHRHGGEIHAESRVGAGATFYFSFG